MKRNLHWLLLVALLVALAFDAIVWSAAAQMPGSGIHLYRSARREAPLTYFYMLAGRPLRALPPLRDYGDAYAQHALSGVADEITMKPELAMEIAHGSGSAGKLATLQWMHYAPPLLFVAWLVAYLRRPKAVHLVARRR
ncbi:MAG TPA: hypothetical protein VND91_10835 [Candidatus Saccharimonadia bacterium]|nr:hypothetical protein [Candidatus Saccharimonadia bacterium]